MFSYLNVRLNRATYWAFMLICAVIVVAVILLLPKGHFPGEIIIVGLGIPRLHDLGRSGWWISTLFAVEILGIAAGAFLGGMDGMFIGAGIATLLILLALVVLGLLPGDPETNDYGPPPPPGVNWRKTD